MLQNRTAMFELMEDPQLTMEPQMAIHDLDTQQVIPEGTASLVDWIKAPVRFFLPSDRRLSFSYKCQIELPRRIGWYASHTQATPDEHYAEQDVHLLSMPPTKIKVNNVIKGDPCTWAPPCNFTAAKPSNNLRSLIRFVSALWALQMLRKLVIHEKIGKDKGESQGIYPSRM